ncbi:MAG TPA: FAD-binding protein, partial [Puia sp.]|nr:FAD-binding protein [Puia sp.]
MIKENVSLRQYNTFGIDASARYFAGFGSAEELGELLAWAGAHGVSLAGRDGDGDGGSAGDGGRLLVLGGGSNILFTKDVKGLVLKMDIRGIDLIKEDESHVYVRAGAGENWHSFVLYVI